MPGPSQDVVAAQAQSGEKDIKRRQRLDEIKTDMHHRLLENLNLAALESAKESELKAEIISITNDELGAMGVVLNREDPALSEGGPQGRPSADAAGDDAARVLLAKLVRLERSDG